MDVPVDRYRGLDPTKDKISTWTKTKILAWNFERRIWKWTRTMNSSILRKIVFKFIKRSLKSRRKDSKPLKTTTFFYQYSCYSRIRNRLADVNRQSSVSMTKSFYGNWIQENWRAYAYNYSWMSIELEEKHWAEFRGYFWISTRSEMYSSAEFLGRIPRHTKIRVSVDKSSAENLLRTRIRILNVSKPVSQWTFARNYIADSGDRSRQYFSYFYDSCHMKTFVYWNRLDSVTEKHQLGIPRSS